MRFHHFRTALSHFDVLISACRYQYLFSADNSMCSSEENKRCIFVPNSADWEKFRADQLWNSIDQRWHVCCSLKQSLTALKHVKSLRQRCSALITYRTSTRVVFWQYAIIHWLIILILEIVQLIQKEPILWKLKQISYQIVISSKKTFLYVFRLFLIKVNPFS